MNDFKKQSIVGIYVNDRNYFAGAGFAPVGPIMKTDRRQCSLTSLDAMFSAENQQHSQVDRATPLTQELPAPTGGNTNLYYIGKPLSGKIAREVLASKKKVELL